MVRRVRKIAAINNQGLMVVL